MIRRSLRRSLRSTCQLYRYLIRNFGRFQVILLNVFNRLSRLNFTLEISFKGTLDWALMNVFVVKNQYTSQRATVWQFSCSDKWPSHLQIVVVPAPAFLYSHQWSWTFHFEKNDVIEHGDMMLPLFDEHKKMRQYLYLLQYNNKRAGGYGDFKGRKIRSDIILRTTTNC